MVSAGRWLGGYGLVVVLALLVLAGSVLGRGRDELKVPVESTEGSFEPGDREAIPPTALPAPDRFWSGWPSGTGVGSLSLGPFPAPPTVEFRLAGYPEASGNRLAFLNTTEDARHEVHVDNPGEEWRTVSVPLPRSWRGDAVVLEVEDGSSEPAGWMAIGEPRAVPAWAAWWDGVVPRAAAVLGVGCLTLFLMTAAALLFRGSRLFAGAGGLMAAAAVVLAAAYLLMWVYFFDHGAGAAALAVILAGASAVCLWRRAPLRELWGDADWRTPALLALAVAAFVTGVLFAFNTTRPAYLVAAQRWADYGFPPDNILPSLLADKLRDGDSLRPFWGDWLSSDRPPLQAAWILLAAPAAQLLGAGAEDAAQYASVWFQLLWVFALWALVRTLGLGPRASVLVVSALALSGFFLVNTSYVWPKLGGGALLMAAFLNWFRPPEGETGAGRHVLGGVQAGLALMSHGSVVFALVPVGILALWRLRSNVGRWAAALAVMLLVAAPWIAYQRFSDPPGDRLLKMHLGGIAEVDDRPLLQAITESYSSLPEGLAREVRWTNVQNQFRGPWSELATFRVSSPNLTRDSDFRYTFFALGWWNLGFVVLAATLVPRVRNRIGAAHLRTTGLLLAWAALTLAVWILLMFTPNSTIIHQGSYTVQLVLFACLAVALWRLHPLAFAAVAAAQAAAFPRVWLSPPLSFAGTSVRADALALCLAAAAAVGVLALARGSRQGDVREPVPEPVPA